MLVEPLPRGRTRSWVPGTDYFHACESRQVLAYGAKFRATTKPAEPTQPRPAPVLPVGGGGFVGN